MANIGETGGETHLTQSELASVRPGRHVREFQCLLCSPPQYLKKSSFRKHFWRYHNEVTTTGWVLVRDAGIVTYGRHIERCQFEGCMAEHLASAATRGAHSALQTGASVSDVVARASVAGPRTHAEEGGPSSATSGTMYEDTVANTSMVESQAVDQVGRVAAVIKIDEPVVRPATNDDAERGGVHIGSGKGGRAKLTSGVTDNDAVCPRALDGGELAAAIIKIEEDVVRPTTKDDVQRVRVRADSGKGGRAKRTSGSTNNDDVCPRALDGAKLDELFSRIQAKHVDATNVASDAEVAVTTRGPGRQADRPMQTASGATKRHTQERLQFVKKKKKSSQTAPVAHVASASTGASSSDVHVPAGRKRRGKDGPSVLDGMAISRSASRTYLTAHQFIWRDKWLKKHGFGEKVCRLVDAEQCLVDGIHADIWGLDNPPTAKGIVSRSVTLEKVNRARVAIRRPAAASRAQQK